MHDSSNPTGVFCWDFPPALQCYSHLLPKLLLNFGFEIFWPFKNPNPINIKINPLFSLMKRSVKLNQELLAVLPSSSFCHLLLALSFPQLLDLSLSAQGNCGSTTQHLPLVMSNLKFIRDGFLYPEFLRQASKDMRTHNFTPQNHIWKMRVGAKPLLWRCCYSAAGSQIWNQGLLGKSQWKRAGHISRRDRLATQGYWIDREVLAPYVSDQAATHRLPLAESSIRAVTPGSATSLGDWLAACQ